MGLAASVKLYAVKRNGGPRSPRRSLSVLFARWDSSEGIVTIPNLFPVGPPQLERAGQPGARALIRDNNADFL